MKHNSVFREIKANYWQFCSRYQLFSLSARIIAWKEKHASIFLRLRQWIKKKKKISLWDFPYISQIESSYKITDVYWYNYEQQGKQSLSPDFDGAVAGPIEVCSWLTGLENGTCCADLILRWIWVGTAPRYTGILGLPCFLPSVWDRCPGHSF